MRQGALFNGFRGSLCKFVKHQGKVPGDISPTIGSVPVVAIQETSEILILVNINGKILADL